MDGLRVTRQVDLSLSRMIDPVRFGDLFKYVVATIRRVSSSGFDAYRCPSSVIAKYVSCGGFVEESEPQPA